MPTLGRRSVVARRDSKPYRRRQNETADGRQCRVKAGPVRVEHRCDECQVRFWLSNLVLCERAQPALDRLRPVLENVVHLQRTILKKHCGHL